MIRIIELFGGIGAPRCALEKITDDFKVMDYIEIDKFAAKSYNLLYDNLKKPEDIKKASYQIDILIHGSPCQDFSIAGLQKGGERGSNTRSSLLWESVRLIRELGELKPRVVIWENVRGLLFKKNENVFNEYTRELKKLGYKSSYKVLDARDFGIPQKRNRVFVVSLLGSEMFDFEKLEKKEMRDINEFLETKVHERYYIKAPSLLKYIDEGSVKEIKKYARTIVTKKMSRDCAGYIKDTKGKRVLTPKESLRLMGFSDEHYYKLEGKISETQIYKQAGNSIVVDVLEAIFKVILKEYLKTNEKEKIIETVKNL